MSRRIPVSCFSSETTGECAVCDFGISSTKMLATSQQKMSQTTRRLTCNKDLSCFLTSESVVVVSNAISPLHSAIHRLSKHFTEAKCVCRRPLHLRIFSQFNWQSNFSPQTIDVARAKLQLLALEACGSKQNQWSIQPKKTLALQPLLCPLPRLRPSSSNKKVYERHLFSHSPLTCIFSGKM